MTGRRAFREPALGHRQQFLRRVEGEYAIDRTTVNRQIAAGADTDLDNRPASGRDRCPSIIDQSLLPHRQIDQPRQDVLFIESHDRAPLFRPRGRLSALSGGNPWSGRAIERLHDQFGREQFGQ